jgi:hypothetical protein
MLCPMPLAGCPLPGLHRRLHPSHKTYRQLVSRDPGLGYALGGTKPIPFLIEDRYNALNDVLEEGLMELELGKYPIRR